MLRELTGKLMKGLNGLRKSYPSVAQPRHAVVIVRAHVADGFRLPASITHGAARGN
jgi:hypothetical protein